MASEAEVIKVISFLCAAYPTFPVKPETVEVYVIMLQDIPADLLKLSAQHAVATNRFFPTVNELREACSKLLGRADDAPTAMAAWGEVMQQVRRVGYLAAPAFSHPLIDQLVKRMGWQELCLSENPTADRARFLQAYEAELSNISQRRLELPGVVEQVKSIAAPDAKQIVSGVVKALTSPTKKG